RVGVAQHAQHLAQLAQGQMRILPDDAGRLPGFLRREVAAVFEGTGMQGNQREPVRQDVMHLPGNAGALVRLGRVDLGFAFPLGAVQLLPLRGRQLPPSPMYMPLSTMTASRTRAVMVV